jgi:hypothetical protein
MRNIHHILLMIISRIILCHILQFSHQINFNIPIEFLVFLDDGSVEELEGHEFVLGGMLQRIRLNYVFNTVNDLFFNF